MNAMQVQLKTIASAQTNQSSPKRKHYCWCSGSNYTNRSKTCSSNKAGHQEEAYYKKSMGGSVKGVEWWLGAIVNKIEIVNHKISLLNYIYTPPNPTSTNMTEIADSGANIHLAMQATPYNGPCNYGKCYESKTTRWKHYGVHNYRNTPATRSKQASETVPHFPQNIDNPINIIGSFMWWWMHHHNKQKSQYRIMENK